MGSSAIVADLSQVESPRQRSFHVFLACTTATMLALVIAGCHWQNIHTSVADRTLALIVVVAISLPVPAYWHEKKRLQLRDAALIIPWAAFVAVLLPFPLLIAARLHAPLQDARLASIDTSLGVSVPAITAWASHHQAGALLNECYLLLAPLLLLAVFVPALTGRVRTAREFVLANLAAFALTVPILATMPAVGPWYHFHFIPNPTQIACQFQLLSLRTPGIYTLTNQGAGIVAFPSFHVFWSLLCAYSLWGFKRVRPLTALIATLIIISTLTTGWHYFTDVIGGILLALLSVLLARFVDRRYAEIPSL